jgi:hypothetical protein
MNLFRYCGDDPIDLHDPLGLDVDVEMYQSTDPLKKWIHLFNPSEGAGAPQFRYSGHGSPASAIIGQLKNPDPSGGHISNANVIKQIKKHDNFPASKSIFLAVCFAGAPGATLAPELAKSANRVVFAPDRMFWVTSTGKYFAADPQPLPRNAPRGTLPKPDLTRLGTIMQFNPDGTSSVKTQYLPGKKPGEIIIVRSAADLPEPESANPNDLLSLYDGYDPAFKKLPK